MELTCKPPLYQSVLDAIKTVVCKANGEWSSPDAKFLCAPCHQTRPTETFRDPNGFLLMDIESGEIFGDTGTLECHQNYHPIGNSSFHCASVDGEPTWVGAGGARCVQTDWYSPTSVSS